MIERYTSMTGADEFTITRGFRNALEIERQNNEFRDGFYPTRDLEERIDTYGRCAAHTAVSIGEIEGLEEAVVALRPVVTQVGEIFGQPREDLDTMGVKFARGAFDTLRWFEYRDSRNIDDWEQHQLFQRLISGVSEEAATQIAAREAQS